MEWTFVGSVEGKSVTSHSELRYNSYHMKFSTKIYCKRFIYRYMSWYSWCYLVRVVSAFVQYNIHLLTVHNGIFNDAGKQPTEHLVGCLEQLFSESPSCKIRLNNDLSYYYFVAVSTCQRTPEFLLHIMQCIMLLYKQTFIYTESVLQTFVKINQYII